MYQKVWVTLKKSVLTFKLSKDMSNYVSFERMFKCELILRREVVIPYIETYGTSFRFRTERLFWGVTNVDYESQFPLVMNWIEIKVPA